MPASKQIELKPCPFCGSSGDLVIYRVSEDAMGCHVKCTRCNARTDEFEDAYTPSADALVAWNQRAEKVEDAPSSTQQMREMAEAFAAMRNDLNELFPIQSEEADLLEGPEFSVACKAIVEAARKYAVDNVLLRLKMKPLHDIASHWKERAETAEAAPAAQPGAGKVKPLEWVEHWGGTYDDLPSWRGKNPLGIHVSVDFIGKYDLSKHSEAPADELAEIKAKAHAHYEKRILAALEPAEPATDVEPEETYYTEGKDAAWYESLSDKDFAWEATKAGMDLTDMNIEAVEKYIPIVAIISGAGDRIERLISSPQPDSRLKEAAKNIIDRMFSTYKARNGREKGIEADDGEKCWIVHSDDIEQLRAALAPAGGQHGKVD